MVDTKPRDFSILTPALTDYLPWVKTAEEHIELLSVILHLYDSLSATLTNKSITKAQISDFTHTHPESDITGLVADLAAKEPLLPTMVGQSLKFLRVNVGETNKEWATVTGGSGTDEVLLVPTANKTIPTNTSIVVGDRYELGSGIVLTINDGANLTVI